MAAQEGTSGAEGASGRAVVVRAGESDSTGFLLAPRLVLTGYLPRAGTIRLTLPGHAEDVPAEAVWSQADEGHDAALLRAERPLLSAEEFAARGPLILAPVRSAAARDMRVEHYGGEPGGEPRLFGDACEFVLHSPGADHLSLRVRRWLDLAGIIGAPVLMGAALVALVGRHRSAQGHIVTAAATLLRDAGFVRQLAEHGVPVTDPALRTAFEQRWRDSVVARYGDLTVNGAAGGTHAVPLDAVWLPPEVLGRRRGAAVEGIEQVLAARHRVLLWGPAGSGKTAVVQRLAVAAAQRRGPFADSVPFVLPLRALMRSGRPLPPPEDFPRAAGFGEAPAGWASEVFAAGRALVLVDGVDEAPPRQRDRVGAWLQDLLAAFRGNRWLITSRPDPALSSWADRYGGFTERSLGPLSAAAMGDLVRRWHRAAGDDEDTAEELLATLRLRGDLTRLATNPLMCTLLCALHLERGRLLRGRAALLDALLGVLRHRDTERGLTEDSAPAHEAQTEVLQRLAYWLVRNGSSEMPWESAVRSVETAQSPWPGMPPAEEFLRLLVVRSGVVHQTASGNVAFLDRAFLDHFAGRAAVLENDLPMLVARAEAEASWEDVFRSAVAFARPRERSLLLAGLVERGGRAGDPARGVRLRLLALSCLAEAPELDPEVRTDILRHAAGLVPPANEEGVALLAAAGPLVLELLPAPEDVDGPTARLIRDLATRIGGPAGAALAQRFAERMALSAAGSGPWLPDRPLPSGWVPDRPAADLARAAPPDGPFASDPGVLMLSAGQPWTSAAVPVHTVVSFGDRARFGALAGLPELRSLALIGNGVAQEALRQLPGLPRLRSLVLHGCSLTDLSVVAATGVMFLELWPTPPPNVLSGLAGAGWLRVLYLPDAAGRSDADAAQAALPTVLVLHRPGGLVDETYLQEPAEVRP
ncbi:NACHT domain-containing protein [Streptomyces johnsoniae]|uniref:NACHT domain-containing protein n=1 Tax=Streptomyces johnsoniae TaxID=3075532 RepID=A0ABU2S0E4_9ACTN|nr:NACHT domain-containing protein [Streptomyces sp. DSM 41886]MDT0442248.1 NACHT domain-containing protein [Streptomyces sp. DSM 41886]